MEGEHRRSVLGMAAGEREQKIRAGDDGEC